MIYRIDMAKKAVIKQLVPDEYKLLGGRSLTSRIALEEIDPACDPLGPKNKLIIAPGLLGGTTAPCSGRLSVGGKSPLTGTVKESNGGGTAAQKLAKLGIKALILENQPEDENWCSLRVSREGVELIGADEAAGKGNYDTAEYYLDKYGHNAAVISIGQAGESQYLASTIAVTDIEGRPSRHCARGGLGAVMGSKKIKAVIIDDQDAPGIVLHDAAGFREVAADWAKTLIASKKVLTVFGTANLVEPMNLLGCMPTRNFSAGSFEKASLLSANKLKELLESRGGKNSHPCHPGCVIRCSNVFNDSQGNYVTASLEYETIVLLGANLEISDLDAIAKMDRFCDDMGLDTMEMGTTLGVLMEAGMIPFGDQEKALAALRQTGEKTLLGRIIGQGTGVAARVLNVRRVPAVKNQGLPAYDPRGLKGTGITYMTSPMGADHTAGNCLPGRAGYRPEAAKPIDVQQGTGHGPISRDLQVLTTVCDLVGLCFFVGANMDTAGKAAQLVNARYGTSLTTEDILQMSIATLKTELEFNRRAGFTRIDDRLPEFFYREELPPRNLVYDVPRAEVEGTLAF